MERINISARWFSHRGILSLFALVMALPLSAQTAKQVLDKTASIVAAKSGAKATFSIKSNQMNASGTIAIKGKKFQATTPQATIWFDGKTQWTYLKKNEEVNVANPTESELAAINPYNFIYMYQKGYKYTMEKKNGSFIVHLTTTIDISGFKQSKLSDGMFRFNSKDFPNAEVIDLR